jgi:hypothetical protein
MQPQLLQIALDPQDVVYSPHWVVRDMVSFFQPSGRILEPCKGDGAFLKCLPDGTDWCEIAEGKDFFAWYERVDWLFGNPPYRMFGRWMYHSMAIASEIVYLLPCDKPFISWKMLKTMRDWGSIKHMRVYGTGASIGFYNVGFAVGALWFSKDYHGPMHISYANPAV